MFVLLILHNDGIYFVGKDAAEMSERANPQKFNVPTQRSMALLLLMTKLFLNSDLDNRSKNLSNKYICSTS